MSARRLIPFVLPIAAAAILAYVAGVVSRETVAVVEARHLLPRWDHATHIQRGWLDYHLLATGRVPHLLWDLWLQGYWPPVHSIYQIPFYALLGGGMAAALWSSLVAFVLVGAIGAAVLWRLWGLGAVLAASVFIALLVSSPFLLGFASLAMSEMPGALAQLVVVLAYANYRQRPNPSTARAFAISLTLLFFTKYNYFLLLVGPLFVHEWIERTSGTTVAERAGGLWRAARRVLSTFTGALTTLYIIWVLVIMRTGGFAFHLLGQRISVRSIGNTGSVVLVLLLARVWYAHRRREIDWPGLVALDLRVRPVLIWFVLPVIVWMASPYPNHIRDFVNLVVNLPVGEPTVEQGAASYLDALRRTYFHQEWVLAAVVSAVVVAGIYYRRQPPVMQWLLVALPMQFAVIALHQTRFPRYLLLTVVLLCLAAASEVGRWLARLRRGAIVAALLAPLVLASGVAAAHRVVHEERFRAIAFEHYADSEPLRQALAVLREELDVDDRLAIGGQNNELSHAVLSWELGPPAGVPCLPYEMSGAARLDLSLATAVLLIVPTAADPATIDEPTFHAAQRDAVHSLVERRELALRHDLPLPDLGVALRFYDRTSPPSRAIPCQW